MQRKLFALIGALTAWRRKGNPVREGYAPYPEAAASLQYNLLFCDKLSLWRTHIGAEREGDWRAVLAESPYVAGLKALASDESKATQVRLLACARLRELKEETAKRQVLGVIVERGTAEGLAVAAAFADGRLQSADASGRVTACEITDAEGRKRLRRLFAQADEAVTQIGPWAGHRLAPPTAGTLRITFLATDALYFGQGAIASMDSDPLAGPILAIMQASVRC